MKIKRKKSEVTSPNSGNPIVLSNKLKIKCKNIEQKPSKRIRPSQKLIIKCWIYNKKSAFTKGKSSSYKWQCWPSSRTQPQTKTESNNYKLTVNNGRTNTISSNNRLKQYRNSNSSLKTIKAQSKGYKLGTNSLFLSMKRSNWISSTISPFRKKSKKWKKIIWHVKKE